MHGRPTPQAAAPQELGSLVPRARTQPLSPVSPSRGSPPRARRPGPREPDRILPSSSRRQPRGSTARCELVKLIHFVVVVLVSIFSRFKTEKGKGARWNERRNRLGPKLAATTDTCRGRASKDRTVQRHVAFEGRICHVVSIQ